MGSEGGGLRKAGKSKKNEGLTGFVEWVRGGEGVNNGEGHGGVKMGGGWVEQKTRFRSLGNWR